MRHGLNARPSTLSLLSACSLRRVKRLTHVCQRKTAVFGETLPRFHTFQGGYNYSATQPLLVFRGRQGRRRAGAGGGGGWRRFELVTGSGTTSSWYNASCREEKAEKAIQPAGSTLADGGGVGGSWRLGFLGSC